MPDRLQELLEIKVDEASQVGPEGLALAYLGERLVIVGDDQQVTPAGVGESIQEMAQLRSQFLAGIPNDHLYDGKLSLFGAGDGAFTAKVSLREHFRCVPDVIRFSNHLCYIPRGQKILPLREAASAHVYPSVVSHRVDGVRSQGGKLNPIEARRVAALFGAMVQHPAYQGLTFGIISLLGAEQSLEIERLIRKHLALDDSQIERFKGGGMTRRLCGEPPNFQGDERTVILLSLVDSPEEGGPLRLVGENDQRVRSRYNVAASRAQDQLWVVHSVDPTNDLQPADLRRRLIEHALDPRRLVDETVEAQREAQSPFEKELIAILVSQGYRVRSQYPVGAYRIDLVVEDGPRRLAIECDGEKAHPPERLKQDMNRQAILERRGWTFVRVRGTAFYRHRERAMAPVFARLKELGIRPTLHAASQPDASVGATDEVVREIVRRAEALERDWETKEADEEERIRAPRLQAVAGRRWRRGG